MVCVLTVRLPDDVGACYNWLVNPSLERIGDCGFCSSGTRTMVSKLLSYQLVLFRAVVLLFLFVL